MTALRGAAGLAFRAAARYSKAKMKPRGIVLACLLPLVAGARLGAIPKPEAFRPDLGVVLVPNTDPDKETSSLVTYVLGCGVVYPLHSGPAEAAESVAAKKTAWSFEPSADLYTAYYEIDALDRAVPTMEGEQDAFVIGLLLDTPIVFNVRLNDKFVFSTGAGLAFDIRVAFQDPDPTVEDGAGAAINAYFWGKGRFVLPSTFLRVEYKLTARVDFGFALRAYWPLFNLWAGEGLPFLDQGIFGGSLGVRYKL